MLTRTRIQYRWPRYILPTRRHNSTLPLISIQNGTFYKHYPSTTHSTASNPPLFPNLTFTLPTNTPSHPNTHQNWSILSPSSLARTNLLHILHGSHLCLPPTARTYPHLSSLATHPSTAIQYIGFDADRTTSGSATRGAYLSARYESRVEETDWTVHSYLTGATSLNPAEQPHYDETLLRQCVKDLRLEALLDMPVGNLSNGQTRRARIAKALMRGPTLLLLDGPFMGLDPPSVRLLSGLLEGLARECRPQVVLSLRAGDEVPKWVTHLVAVEGVEGVRAMGRREEVVGVLEREGWGDGERRVEEEGQESVSVDGLPERFGERTLGEMVVEMKEVRISYGERSVLGAWEGGLDFSLRQGQRLAILGPNGSGKTTLLSLITSDHPQSYAQDVKILGRSRLPSKGERGITLFELQRRIGHASPEVHSFFPKSLSLRRSLESAWADAPMSRPKVGEAERHKVEEVLSWFADELNTASRRSGPSTTKTHALEWADETRFGELSFSGQRLLLFLRALIAGQEIVVLDEVFSGMDKVVREKAFRFLAHGTEGEGETGQGGVPGLSDKQALIVIAHDKGDMPGCIRDWICLPEPAGKGEKQKAPRTGELPGPLELNPEAWDDIWGTS
ncbi:elongation factor 3 [Elsinoe australis]|uniref:Elongation factor 3 n=1 Tax=Elsinoe australis TaxID=40998 RepID=A0A2P8AG67_9PEZI|nr:elongation factor 3 [Elsinoe australis]